MSKNQMEHLVKKHQWDKIGKQLHSADAQSRLALATDLATACGSSLNEGAVNTLIYLLNVSDENVLMQAVKSLGAVGNDNAKTHLQSLFDHLPDGKDSIKDAIKESIVKINIRIRNLVKV
jgi:HEAT repeat protein